MLFITATTFNIEQYHSLLDVNNDFKKRLVCEVSLMICKNR